MYSKMENFCSSENQDICNSQNVESEKKFCLDMLKLNENEVKTPSIRNIIKDLRLTSKRERSYNEWYNYAQKKRLDVRSPTD